ncbi:MAG TPA: amino acid adenylation domain-containing protein, partial [Longimicrobium sp.]|nr:amino acid adenylation domain-containing protein [Longimicrobium sp.]
ARQWVEAEMGRPFDLQTGPLFRATVLELGAADHLLVMCAHHAVSDGWSTGVLLRELGALYEAYLRGQPSPLPELPVQYADYAAWQRRALTEEVLAGELEYWTERLAGAPTLLELPTDRPRPASRAFRGSRVIRELPMAVETALDGAFADIGATPFMVLLAAYLHVLARWAGQSDVVVGTPIANRSLPETEGLIGFFANTLALRVELSGDPTFRELVARVRESALGAFAHQDLPFEKLVQALAPERDLGYTPVFQVAFAFQDGLIAEPSLAGLETRVAGGDRTIAKFDLTLTVASRDGRRVAVAEYDSDLYDRGTAERLVEHFGHVLEQVGTEPDARLSRVSLGSEAERRRVLVEWNATSSAYPGDAGLAALFAEQASRAPEAEAVAYGAERASYGELASRSARLAARLRAAGVGTETRVGLCAERGVDLVVGMLAIARAGGVYVPLDPSYPAERLGYMLADSGATHLLAQPGAGAGVSAAGVVEVALEDADGPEAPLPPALGGERLAYVIYTSGSTGQPKGIAVPERGVIRLVRGSDYARVGAGERVAQASNASFDAATFEIWGALLNGGSVVGIGREELLEPERFVAALRRERVDTLFVTTALFNQTVRAVPDAFATLRQVLFGGERVDTGVVARALAGGARRLLHVYGPTESTTFSSWHAVADADGATVPIGRGVANTTLYVLDGAMEPAPVGVAGELYVGGAGLARGYLGRAGLTGERFVPDPFGAAGGRLYRTGDVARWNGAGAVEFVGRVDEQVKVRGFRVEPGEVEAVLREHAGVRDCVVLARGEAGGTRRLVAYTAHGGEAVGAGRLREYLRERLPEYMVPGVVVEMAALPLNANGKVDRGALPEGVEEAVGGEAGEGSPVEGVVAGVWAEVLGVGEVERGAGFFAQGGHSLLAVRVGARVREVLGVEVPLRALFEAGTLAEYAGRVEALRRSAGAGGELPPVEAVDRTGEIPLSFAQERLWLLDRIQPGGAYNVPVALRLSGVLDVAALREALGEIVRRHESLRTVFRVGADGRPVQVIRPVAPLDLRVEPVPGASAAERDAEALRVAAEAAETPFDLERGPLFRARLLGLEPGHHVLLLTLHHAVSDGWSIDVLLGEASTLYHAFTRGAPSPLPDLPVQYADYAIWQRRHMDEASLEPRLAYWRARLAGAPERLELPTDHARPAVRSQRGARERLELPGELRDAVRALARRHGATPNMALLAAWALLLGRYSGQDDVVVGSPIAGRGRAETAPLVGFFVNVLALRLDLSGDPTFAELLARVRGVTLDAYEHGDLPFERVVEELRPERSLSLTPLFQVAFSHHVLGRGEFALDDVAASRLEVPYSFSKFDLTLETVELPGALRLVLEYSTELFDAVTARAVLRHLASVLRHASAEPSPRLSEV